MNLTPASEPLVRQAIVEALAAHGGDSLVGISCLARGADTIFARAVLELGGSLEVVVPAADYRTAKVDPGDGPEFDDLVRRAARVRTLPFARANRDAYAAANEVLLGVCDELYAVWDGQSGVDRGSTGEVVAQARTRGIPVRVIWPAGAARQVL